MKKCQAVRYATKVIPGRTGVIRCKNPAIWIVNYFYSKSPSLICASCIERSLYDSKEPINPKLMPML